MVKIKINKIIFVLLILLLGSCDEKTINDDPFEAIKYNDTDLDSELVSHSDDGLLFKDSIFELRKYSKNSVCDEDITDLIWKNDTISRLRDYNCDISPLKVIICVDSLLLATRQPYKFLEDSDLLLVSLFRIAKGELHLFEYSNLKWSNKDIYYFKYCPIIDPINHKIYLLNQALTEIGHNYDLEQEFVNTVTELNIINLENIQKKDVIFENNVIQFFEYSSDSTDFRNVLKIFN